MVATTDIFSGFAVKDITQAETFYRDTLGLPIEKNAMDALTLTLPDGDTVFIYPKPDHTPATYTILNLVVADIDTAVDELAAAGVTFTRYEGAHQDEKGIARGKAAGRGPDIAWFADPSGNILSVLAN